MEYYSVIKNNEIMPFAATWVDLEMIIIREVRKTNTVYHLYVEPMADACWCMAKPIQYCKVKKNNNKLKKNTTQMDISMK